MKCVSCGYNLGLEDNWCPHCGRKNEQAAMHNRDMARYNKEFEDTLNEVKSNARKFNSVTVKITLASFMVILILLTVIVSINSYDIISKLNERDVHKNLSKHEAMLDGYIAARDPMGFVTYYDNNKIQYGSNKDVRKYDAVNSVSRSYRTIYTETVRLADKSQLNDYLNEDHCIESIGRFISNIKEYSEYAGSNTLQYDDGRDEYIKYIMQLTEDTMQVYFKLTDEEAAGIWDMNTGKLYALLEEGLER